MHKFKVFIHLLLLATTPSLLAYSHSPYPHLRGPAPLPSQHDKQGWVRPTTYDEIMHLLDALESGELENTYTPLQLQELNEYLATLAHEGLLPDETHQALALAEDIDDLLCGTDSPWQSGYCFAIQDGYMIVPSVFQNDFHPQILRCGRISHAWKKTKAFVKKHKKEIIIGAAIIVAAVAVVAVVAASAGAATAAAGAAGAAAASGSKPESVSGMPTDDMPMLKSAVDEQIALFKENISQEPFFQLQEEGLSWEETGRVLGPLFAHESLQSLHHQIASSPQLAAEVQSLQEQFHYALPTQTTSPLALAHAEIDRRFSTDYAPLFVTPEDKTPFNTLSYQMRGEKALAFGYYSQAVSDFGKVIDMHPLDPIPYLQRSASYFNMGQYDHSLDDFHAFAAQLEQKRCEYPFCTARFSLGLAKGLPRGVYESGEGLLVFFAEFMIHPVHTSRQLIESFSALVSLARVEDWKTIREALAPEICEVIVKWKVLTSEQRGELIGYALGKHGGDILLPGALVKVSSKSVRAAQKLSEISKNVKVLNEALVLEAAAEIGNSAKVAELVTTSQRTAYLAEDLGFSSREMGQLKQAGKLEEKIQNSLRNILQDPTLKESYELFQKAEAFLAPYAKKFLPETQVRDLIHQTGINTFPRPIGIPENFRVRLSNDGAGMLYVHPEHTHISIRVMPGKPYSPNPKQQRPYVVHMKNGKAVDVYGNIIDKKAIEAHISLEEFVYRE